MRLVPVLMVVLMAACGAAGQQTKGPTDAKAKKTFADGEEWARRGDSAAAIASFRKANKEDGGHCAPCAYRIIDTGVESGDFGASDAAAQQLIADAKDAAQIATAHLERATVLYREGVQKKKQEFYVEADRECRASLAAYANAPGAEFLDGMALARLNRDDEAKEQFRQFLARAPKSDVNHIRAGRFLANPDLVRARMAPSFSIATLDGQQVSLDGLAGKVVLIDFWATWCGPCREALPHIREIAKSFSSEPLVVMSISIDSDEAKWKDFVAKNGMTWMQYRDSSGAVSKQFAVRAIPQTFTIDADGVLQDQHIGDGMIEGKLHKLCARARALQETPQGAPGSVR